ncbi:WXG100 family type VII secretion target [Microbacterium sp. NPDC089188]|uniref:WXG100 family type VII secretion target n=1 Tax=Microbacterium sp. NPDC089188 TaxID=3154971 RepID=UPI00344931B5
MHLDEDSAVGSIAIVREAIDRIDEHLTTLENEAARLQASWDGDARDAFATAMREWDESVRVLRAAAAAAGERAHGAVRRFGDFDRRRAGAWA